MFGGFYRLGGAFARVVDTASITTYPLKDVSGTSNLGPPDSQTEAQGQLLRSCAEALDEERILLSAGRVSGVPVTKAAILNVVTRWDRISTTKSGSRIFFFFQNMVTAPRPQQWPLQPRLRCRLLQEQAGLHGSRRQLQSRWERRAPARH